MKRQLSMRRRARNERGFVLFTIIVILLLVAVTGTMALRSSETRFVTSAKLRKSDLLAHAAEAGAARKLAEASLVSNPSAFLESGASPTNGTWTTWPDASVGFSSVRPEQLGLVRYRTGPTTLRWSGQHPPPGVDSRTRTYIFDFTSYATLTEGANPSGLDSGEAQVAVSFKTWDSHPGSYAP